MCRINDHFSWVRLRALAHNCRHALGVLSLAFCAVIAMTQNTRAQSTVTINWRDSNFPTQFNAGGDFFNEGTAELGMYANINNTAKQTVAWKNFTIDGSTGGTARSLQVGDVFSITVSATRAFGQIGFSLNSGGTQGSSYANNISGSRMFVNTDNYGSWYVGGLSGGPSSNASLGYTPSQNVFRDYVFSVRITSQTTADITLGVAGSDFRAFNRVLGGSAGANISAFSIYGSDMWDGDSNENAYWKQTTTIVNSGRVELGYYAASGTTVAPGVISDGLAANSTSTASPNAVFIGGDAGSQVNLTAANTYTGATTVNANARLEIQNASALGGTANGTSVTSSGALSLYQATGGITITDEALTLNGVGVSGANGALRNTGGNNQWNGAISLGSNSRINADTTGSSGSLTIGGNVSGGGSVLFLGAAGGTGGNTGGNITINGVISGAGATQNGTTTSIYKDGVGALTHGGANNYTGDTRIAQGNLAVASGGSLGSGSDVFIADGASLTVNANATVASLQEWGTTNSGTATIGTGATLTVSGNDYNTFMNSIGGGGNLVKSGTGTMNLFGTQGYTGTTTVSGGRLNTDVALASSGVTVSGGTFEAEVANVLGDSAAVTVSSGTYLLGGNDTIGALSGTGGAINLGANRLTTTVSSGSSSYTGGAISGTGGGVTKAGIGRFDLGGTHSYTGNTEASAGELRLVGASLASSSVSVSSGAKLSGYGSVGTIGGPGSIDPGNSPGIIATTQVNPSQGTDYNFEFTGPAPTFNAPAASVNDLIRATGATPFSQSLSAANIINIYFSGSALFAGSSPVQYTGGFFTDQSASFAGSISGATFNYFFQNNAGSIGYNDANYYTRSQYETLVLGTNMVITLSTVAQTADFGGGNIIGQILRIDVVPEPSTYALLVFSAVGVAGYMIRRRRR